MKFNLAIAAILAITTCNSLVAAEGLDEATAQELVTLDQEVITELKALHIPSAANSAEVPAANVTESTAADVTGALEGMETRKHMSKHKQHKVEKEAEKEAMKAAKMAAKAAKASHYSMIMSEHEDTAVEDGTTDEEHLSMPSRAHHSKVDKVQDHKAKTHKENMSMDLTSKASKAKAHKEKMSMDEMSMDATSKASKAHSISMPTTKKHGKSAKRAKHDRRSPSMSIEHDAKSGKASDMSLAMDSEVLKEVRTQIAEMYGSVEEVSDENTTTAADEESPEEESPPLNQPVPRTDPAATGAGTDTSGISKTIPPSIEQEITEILLGKGLPNSAHKGHQKKENLDAITTTDERANKASSAASGTARTGVVAGACILASSLLVYSMVA